MKTNCGCVYMLITEYLGDIQFSRMVFRVCKQKQTRTFVKSLLITRCFFQLHYACCHILHHHYTICHGILLHPCCNLTSVSTPFQTFYFISFLLVVVYAWKSNSAIQGWRARPIGDEARQVRHLLHLWIINCQKNNKFSQLILLSSLLLRVPAEGK